MSGIAILATYLTFLLWPSILGEQAAKVVKAYRRSLNGGRE